MEYTTNYTTNERAEDRSSSLVMVAIILAVIALLIGFYLRDQNAGLGGAVNQIERTVTPDGTDNGATDTNNQGGSAQLRVDVNTPGSDAEGAQ